MTATPPRPARPTLFLKVDTADFRQGSANYSVPANQLDTDLSPNFAGAYPKMQGPNPPFYAGQGYQWQGPNANQPYPPYMQQSYPPQGSMPYIPPQQNARNANGYPNGYNPRNVGFQQPYQQGYPQFLPQQYPQMGGPGPATMQNGYGGFPGPGGSYYSGGYPHAPFDPSQQNFVDPSMAPLMNGVDGQYPDPSQFQGGPNYAPRPPAFPSMNGQQFPNGAPMPYPPYQQYPGYPYPAPPDGMLPPQQSPYQQHAPQAAFPAQASGSMKSLNPAAQGFSFAPPAGAPPPVPRSDQPPPNPPPAQSDVAPQMPNGTASDGEAVASGPTQGSSIGTAKPEEVNSSAASALGLSHMAVLSIPAPPATVSTEESSAQTPMQTSGINFVGSPISSTTSPPASLDAMLPDPPSKEVKPVGKTKVSGVVPAVVLAKRRPHGPSGSGVLFASTLADRIPSNIDRETMPSEKRSDGVTGRTARDERKRSQAKGLSLRRGLAGQKRKANVGGRAVAFGSLTEEESEAVRQAARAERRSAAKARQTPSAPAKANAPPRAVSAPKPKPASWAALLQPTNMAAASSCAASSVASKVVSPSKSTISLDAGHPDVTSPTSTPASSAVPVLPTTPHPADRKGSSVPPSTGASASKGPRPAFNYAAAAAAGSSLSPADETAQILSDGLKTRPKDGKDALVLPRGLINTGNMCFANTVLQVLVYCQPFNELFSVLRQRLKADLARKTPLMEAMMCFLQEFEPVPGQAYPLASLPASASASGASTPTAGVQANGTAAAARSRTQACAGQQRDLRKDAFVPENVYGAMKENKRFDSMRRGFQEDAEEYLGFFLTTLHEEMLHLLSRTHVRSSSTAAHPAANGDSGLANAREVERPVSPGAEGGDGWLEVGKKQKTNVVRKAEATETAITRLFGGTIRSVLHTPGQKDSVTLEPYQPLQVDIQDASVMSIVDALKGISVPETVPMWSAARNETVDATKTVFVELFPPVLILHLKRFVYDPAEHNVVKRGKVVAYGTELIIPTEIISPAKRSAGPIKYKLLGVIYHHGSTAMGGHYTVAAARQDGKGWNHFDDEAVYPVPTDQVVVSPEEASAAATRDGGKQRLLIGGRERCAYLLFWQRVR